MQIAPSATTLWCLSRRKCALLNSRSRPAIVLPANHFTQVCFPFCWKVQKWAQLHVSTPGSFIVRIIHLHLSQVFTSFSRYSHDGKQQPCKFLFGKGKCEHGSSCRFSHDTPSAEALAIVREQWKNGGIKIARDTIESCELKAFDTFMSLDRSTRPLARAHRARAGTLCTHAPAGSTFAAERGVCARGMSLKASFHPAGFWHPACIGAALQPVARSMLASKLKMFRVPWCRSILGVQTSSLLTLAFLPRR